MIIDCHTHINNYHEEHVAALDSSLEKLQLSMQRNRVDMALILTSYIVNPGRPSTKDTVKATRDMRHIFVVAGISYLNFKKEDLSELREYIQDGSVRGIKIYPGYEPFYPNDPELYPAYDLAEEFDIPLMIHSGDTYTPKGKIKFSHPIHVDDLAVDRPKLNIVICHLGNPWFRDCMEVVYKNANVFTDISGLVLGDFNDRFEQFMQKQLQEMLLWGVDPDNVLFGTDWPISSMESYIEFIEELKIPEKERNKIMYENTARLFKLELTKPSVKGNSSLAWWKK